MAFEIFLHANGRKPLVVMVEDGDVLADLLESAGLGGGAYADALVFVGEGEDVLIDVEADDHEDQAQPVDKTRTVKDLDLHRHRHVHVGHCKRVKVDVNYGAKTKHRKVAPSTTIGVLTAWARKAFKLDADAASEYVLEITGTKDQPRPDVHVGELTSAPTCSVSFDLIKEITPQG